MRSELPGKAGKDDTDNKDEEEDAEEEDELALWMASVGAPLPAPTRPPPGPPAASRSATHATAAAAFGAAPAATDGGDAGADAGADDARSSRVRFSAVDDHDHDNDNEIDRVLLGEREQGRESAVSSSPSSAIVVGRQGAQKPPTHRSERDEKDRPSPAARPIGIEGAWWTGRRLVGGSALSLSARHPCRFARSPSWTVGGGGFEAERCR